MNRIGRREFIGGAVALGACAAVGASSRREPLLLDAKRMAIHDVPVTDMWLPDFKCDDDATHQKYTGVSNKVIKRNLERLVAAKAKLEIRCLVVPGLTEDMSARYTYLDSIGVPRSSVVELEYFDYARSKYKALGIPDTMPRKRYQGSGKGDQG